MKKEFFRNLFCLFFLSIFFMKMLISAAPLLISYSDSKIVNAVIMQLEIEDDSEKTPDKMKDILLKEYCNTLPEFIFSNPLKVLAAVTIGLEDCKHLQTFYPTVPTPPPNA